MPGRNGTGPLGQGTMTGRGLGFCRSANQADNSRGLSGGRGLGAGSRRNRRFCRANADKKSLLTEEKKLLQARLEKVNQQLEDI